MHVEDGTPYLESLVDGVRPVDGSVAGRTVRDGAAAAAPLPLSLRDGVLAARPEHDDSVDEDGRTAPSRGEGLRGRRERQRPTVAGTRVSCPEELSAVLRSEPPEGLCQFIFCGLFVCVFRYVADALETHSDYSEEQFWISVREAIEEYQARVPGTGRPVRTVRPAPPRVHEALSQPEPPPRLRLRGRRRPSARLRTRNGSQPAPRGGEPLGRESRPVSFPSASLFSPFPSPYFPRHP